MASLRTMLCVFYVSLILPSFGFSSSIQWRETLESAQHEAKERNMPILAVFYMSWCEPSQYLLQHTLEDEGMVQFVNQNTIPVKLDGDLNTVLFQSYGVYA